MFKSIKEISPMNIILLVILTSIYLGTSFINFNLFIFLSCLIVLTITIVTYKDISSMNNTANTFYNIYIPNVQDERLTTNNGISNIIECKVKYPIKKFAVILNKTSISFKSIYELDKVNLKSFIKMKMYGVINHDITPTEITVMSRNINKLDKVFVVSTFHIDIASINIPSEKLVLIHSMTDLEKYVKSV